MFQPANGLTDAVHGEPGLVYQRCRWCGTASFRRLLCPVCSSNDLEPQHTEGYGVVVRTTVVHRYSRLARNESLVRFPEGFMFHCRVTGTPPHLVWAGDRVRPAGVITADSTQLVFEVCNPGAQERWR
ncbi:zinc ribbon domain-containing protein [Streptomyces albipurpureus]|uniref:Zinc ribbon domain-containing protein n=1 Tax=Streptomyces albipurpureus TaxID=2897419 RepID=A0ABT0UK25_9ACTN|nr:zinc ribbon domain-containing protein [Streptomyces sp. CWNU-1]MCM2387626.1 zinc ribbon domain-containing protein [Streptomyces sp. CWNU-1]